jgi:hypothetical protein
MKITSAAAATVIGTSQPNAGERHHGRDSVGGSIRIIAASAAWHREQSAACAPAAVRSAGSSVPSNQAASTPASRQPSGGSGAAAFSVSRSR